MNETINAAALTGNIKKALDIDNFSWELMRAADADKNGVVTAKEANHFISEAERAAQRLDHSTKIDGTLTLKEMKAAATFFSAVADMVNRNISKAKVIKPDTLMVMLTYTNKAAALERATRELRAEQQLANNRSAE